jgi:hypothetical protein
MTMEALGYEPFDQLVAMHAEPEPAARVAVASMLLHTGRGARLVMGGMADWLELDLPVQRHPATA